MRVAVVLVGLSIALAGCTNPDGTTNNTATGGLIGGGAGAVVGGALGDLFGHSAMATAAGAAVGGLAGYFAGTYIGQQLDERDREAAANSTLAVLDEPAPTPEPGHTVYVPHARPKTWSSDHTTARGSTTLVKVSTTPDGNECRLTRQLAVINGQEVEQHVNYCQTASGGWKAENA
jgi:phage tail tape-measure protein